MTRTHALAALCLVAMSLAMIGCTASTDPATNVTDTAADLNVTVSWNQGEAGHLWFEYAPQSGSTWTRTTDRSFAPMPNTVSNVALVERLRPSCMDVDDPCSQATLDTSATYKYRFCGYLTAPAPAGTPANPVCWDGAGTAGGTAYDTFTTEPPASTDDSPNIPACPTTAADGVGWMCIDQDEALAAAATYSFHRSDTAHYGIGITEIGTFQHTRDLNFSGRQGLFWQSGDVLSGPPVRYDFHMTIYRGAGHSIVADSYRNIEPNSGFSVSRQTAPIWFVYHHSNQYHVHYLAKFRVQGVNNPSTPDGTFHTEQTISPYYYCGSGNCQFP